MDSESARAVVDTWMEILGYTGPYFMTELPGGFSGDILWLAESPKDAFEPFVARFFPMSRAGRFQNVYKTLEICQAAQFPANCPMMLDLPEKIEEEDAARVWGGMAYSYIRGHSLGRTLLQHNSETAYALGQEAGKLLYRFHSLDIPCRPRADVVRKTILKYERSQEALYRLGISFAGQDQIESFIEESLPKMTSWPVTRVHDDFHPRNLIEKQTRIQGVIDFDRMDDDDPIQDLRKIPWFTLPLSAEFASAQFQTYAEVAQAPDLWQRYNLYVAMSISASLVWMAGREDRAGLTRFQQQIMEIVNTHDFHDGGPPSWFQESH